MTSTSERLVPRLLLCALTALALVLSFAPPAAGGSQEVCDGQDNDGDGTIDEDAVDATLWYPDSDSDGYGDASAIGVLACDAPPGYVATNDDPDDSNENVYPGAQEICDGIDNDGDDTIDEDPVDATLWYPDNDSDGYGDAFATGALGCDAPAGYVADNTDSDDTDSGVNPGAQEVCDPENVDEDSDGTADDEDTSATGKTTWYVDADGDGYGDPGNSLQACDPPVGYVDNGDDVNDEDETVGPGPEATSTTVNVTKTEDFVKAKGTVTPVPEGETIVVKFQRRVDGKWSLINKKTPEIKPTGYKATFSRPNKGGKFRFVARFAGNEEFEPSKAVKEFNL